MEVVFYTHWETVKDGCLKIGKESVLNRFGVYLLWRL